MPLSSDKKAREKQLKNLKFYESRQGYRQTKPIRFYLPVDLAEKWEKMDHKDRNELLKRVLE